MRAAARDGFATATDLADYLVRRGMPFRDAHEAVARIMVLARSLDGVISGEHGIGITKLEFLTDEELRPFAEYKRKVDPEGRFNKGKLLRNQELPALDGQALEANLASNPRHLRARRSPYRRPHRPMACAQASTCFIPSLAKARCWRLKGWATMRARRSTFRATAPSGWRCRWPS